MYRLRDPQWNYQDITTNEHADLLCIATEFGIAWDGLKVPVDGKIRDE